jgi:3-(3-hydroxy-phenyl)propionate hydroxylase
VWYAASPLTVPPAAPGACARPAPGQPAPEALLAAPHGPFHVSQAFGKDFVCLVFGDGALPEALAQLTAAGIGVLEIPAEADQQGQARERYGLEGFAMQALVLVRPDGYVMGRWHGLDPAPLLAALAQKGLTP